MELLRITRQIHCKAVEQRATLIHRQYNRDWRTSYSRPPIDPYLTPPLLQNPGGATGSDTYCWSVTSTGRRCLSSSECCVASTLPPSPVPVPAASRPGRPVSPSSRRRRRCTLGTSPPSRRPRLPGPAGHLLLLTRRPPPGGPRGCRPRNCPATTSTTSELVSAGDSYNVSAYNAWTVAGTLAVQTEAPIALNWGPIYKISYDNLTIILR